MPTTEKKMKRMAWMVAGLVWGSAVANGASPLQGSIGYVMLRNVQDMRTQCSNTNLSHNDKSWCYQALSKYAWEAAQWSYVKNALGAGASRANASSVLESYKKVVSDGKAKCQRDNGDGNWADVNVAECEVSTALSMMNVRDEKSAAAATVTSKSGAWEPQASAPSPRATPAGIRVEADASFSDWAASNLKVIDSAIALVQANGYRCDSLSSAREMILHRGFIVVCNQFAYKYEIQDKGGNWIVSVD